MISNCNEKSFVYNINQIQPASFVKKLVINVWFDFESTLEFSNVKIKKVSNLYLFKYLETIIIRGNLWKYKKVHRRVFLQFCRFGLLLISAIIHKTPFITLPVRDTLTDLKTVYQLGSDDSKRKTNSIFSSKSFLVLWDLAYNKVFRNYLLN